MYRLRLSETGKLYRRRPFGTPSGQQEEAGGPPERTARRYACNCIDQIPGPFAPAMRAGNRPHTPDTHPFGAYGFPRRRRPAVQPQAGEFTWTAAPRERVKLRPPEERGETVVFCAAAGGFRGFFEKAQSPLRFQLINAVPSFMLEIV